MLTTSTNLVNTKTPQNSLGSVNQTGQSSRSAWGPKQVSSNSILQPLGVTPPPVASFHVGGVNLYDNFGGIPGNHLQHLPPPLARVVAEEIPPQGSPTPNVNRR